MAGIVSIFLQKATGGAATDDVITIARNRDNGSLFDVTMRPYNGKKNFEGLMSHNDMLTYCEYVMSMVTTDHGDDSIASVQYNIPGFPSICLSSYAMNEDSVYNAFIDALVFWATTM
jgi:hypothetical protein